MFSLRPVTPHDLSALQALILRSVRALSLGHYIEVQIESALRHALRPDTRLVADGTYFVAEAGAEIVGCGGWNGRRTLYGRDQSRADEDERPGPGSDPAHIRAFFVHPDWARWGIGSRLLHACFQAAREAWRLSFLTASRSRSFAWNGRFRAEENL